MDFEALNFRVISLEKYRPMLEEMFTEYTNYKNREAAAAKAEDDAREADHHEQWLKDQAEAKEAGAREKEELERAEAERIAAEQPEEDHQPESDDDYRARLIASIKNFGTHNDDTGALETVTGSDLDGLGERYGFPRQ